MKRAVNRTLKSAIASVFVISTSACIHYDKTAFYTGGPDYPRDIIQHSETWTIVDLHADLPAGHVAEGDTIRLEHSGNRKRPKMIWRGTNVDADGDGTADGDEEVEVEMRELKVGNYDFETVRPVRIGDHDHIIRIRKNYEGSDVAGEIVFWFEDSGTGQDHGGHAGGGR